MRAARLECPFGNQEDTMDSDRTVPDAMLDSVANQIDTGDPPEARATYERLTAAGQSKSQALRHMADALRVEMDRMLADSQPFDNARYAALLAKIPSEG